MRPSSCYFNPRSPCGERPLSTMSILWDTRISIHAPRVGSDVRSFRVDSCNGISIHAPRVGSDPDESNLFRFQGDFNPRSPCGERPICSSVIPRFTRYFNPRSPCGERLTVGSAFHPGTDFNPRSPCGERLPIFLCPAQQDDYFNPRSPCGERRCVSIARWARRRFQSTLPVWGATEDHTQEGEGRQFQSTLPVWGATAKLHKYFLKFYRI